MRICSPPTTSRVDGRLRSSRQMAPRCQKDMSSTCSSSLRLHFYWRLASYVRRIPDLVRYSIPEAAQSSTSASAFSTAINIADRREFDFSSSFSRDCMLAMPSSSSCSSIGGGERCSACFVLHALPAPEVRLGTCAWHRGCSALTPGCSLLTLLWRGAGGKLLFEAVVRAPNRLRSQDKPDKPRLTSADGSMRGSPACVGRVTAISSEARFLL